MLDATEEAVTTALRRARATLQAQLPPSGQRDQPPPPQSAAERDLVERVTQAFEANDVERIVALLREDARFTMPPLPFEWQGDADTSVLPALAQELAGKLPHDTFALLPGEGHFLLFTHWHDILQTLTRAATG